MIYSVLTARVIFMVKISLDVSVLDENMFGLVQSWVSVYL